MDSIEIGKNTTVVKIGDKKKFHDCRRGLNAPHFKQETIKGTRHFFIDHGVVYIYEEENKE